MKICSVCLKNDLLCNACSKKVTSGQISKIDVDISRAIYKLGIEADFLKSFDFKDYYAVLADKKDSGLLIGRGGRNVRRLGIMLGKSLRIIEDTKDEKEIIENIISSPVLGVNKVYAKNEFYKIRVESRNKKRIDPLKSLVSEILGKEVRFLYE
jgi:transcription antitermination factor NusA-like protein